MLILTKKFLVILSFGFAFALIGFFFHSLLFLLYLFYLVLITLVILDSQSIVKKRELEITRIHEKYLSIGAHNLIKIQVINNSKKTNMSYIRDIYPLEFIVKNDSCELNLSAFTSQTESYYVKPIKKGSYDFLSTDIRVEGKLGLTAFQYKFNNKTSVSVYPNIIELKKYIKLSSQNRQEQLGYKKALPGGEVEFDFLREYIAGDPYKKINWKATARKRYPIIEIDQKELNRNIISVLDTGRMMTTYYGFLNKLDYAIDTTLILAAAARQKKDNFGFLAFSDKINSFVPLSRRNNILQMILSNLYNMNADFVKTDYMKAYKYLKNRIRKNSIIFVFSELYNKIVSKELVDFLMLISKHHKVEFVSFEEFEEGSNGKTYIDIIRHALQQEQIIEKEAIIKDLFKKGIHTIRVNEKNIKEKVINAYLSS